MARSTRDPALVVPATARSSTSTRLARHCRTARLDLPRLYEDDEILVIDKPAGLLTIASDPESRATEDTVLRPRAGVRPASAWPRTVMRVSCTGSIAAPPAHSPSRCRREAHRAGRALFGDARIRTLVPGSRRRSAAPRARHDRGAHLQRVRSGRRRVVRRRARRPPCSDPLPGSRALSRTPHCSNFSSKPAASTRSACTCSSWVTRSSARACTSRHLEPARESDG